MRVTGVLNSTSHAITRRSLAAPGRAQYIRMTLYLKPAYPCLRRHIYQFWSQLDRSTRNTGQCRCELPMGVDVAFDRRPRVTHAASFRPHPYSHLSSSHRADVYMHTCASTVTPSRKSIQICLGGREEASQRESGGPQRNTAECSGQPQTYRQFVVASRAECFAIPVSNQAGKDCSRAFFILGTHVLQRDMMNV